MRAMLLRRQAAIASSPLEAAEAPDPVPGPGEIRVRVSACAGCRTDLHVIEGDLKPRRMPIIPGHQIVGIVEALGAGARRFRGGERVGIAWLRSTCGACRFCKAGRENLCEESTYTGWTHDGGYAEQCCVPEAFAYAIPPAFDDTEAAPLLCAGMIGYRALKRSQVPRGGKSPDIGAARSTSPRETPRTAASRSIWAPSGPAAPASGCPSRRMRPSSSPPRASWCRWRSPTSKKAAPWRWRAST
jgi:D-arabinose 1-dehydrogenase-like Zn-dependent alcohol dehydrogenase